MKQFFKDLLYASILGVIICIVHALILFVVDDPWYGGGVFEFIWQNQLFSVALYLVNNHIIRFFKHRFREDFWTTRHLSYAIFCGVIGTVLTVFLLRVLLIVLIMDVELQVFLKAERVEDYYLPFFISAVATSGYYLVLYWKNTQETRVKESKIIAGQASAKFDALKNQLDPHFLFNSLNVLASLIEENPKQATKFTTSLSKVYRYVLEQKNKELVPLEEELAFARTYMNLIKMRFEDSIVVDIPERSSHEEYKVVPLSLQLLLENAVKHNQVTPTKKLHIKIYEEGNKLYIKNNIQEKQVVKKSSGVGLLNIKQRYHLLSTSQVEINDDGRYFQVGIPMLTKTTQVTFAPKQSEMLEDKRYERAKKKVEELKGFYIHFTIYSIMVPVFIYFNYVSKAGIPWALFPILGWGWGVLNHASETFGWSPVFNKNWEKRKLKRLMEDEDF